MTKATSFLQGVSHQIHLDNTLPDNSVTDELHTCEGHLDFSPFLTLCSVTRVLSCQLHLLCHLMKWAHFFFQKLQQKLFISCNASWPVQSALMEWKEGPLPLQLGLFQPNFVKVHHPGIP